MYMTRLEVVTILIFIFPNIILYITIYIIFIYNYLNIIIHIYLMIII